MVSNRGNVMKKKYLLLLSIVILFFGCIDKNYTSEIKKVLNPMQKN